MTFDAITQMLHERSDTQLKFDVDWRVGKFFEKCNILDEVVPVESILHFLTKINPYEPILVTNNIRFKDLSEMLKNALFEAMKDAARKKEVAKFITNINNGYYQEARQQAPITQETKMF